VADPSPTIEYGMLWFEDSPSAALPAFLESAREVARKNPPPANAGSAVVIWFRAELGDPTRSYWPA
jgi:hypothetical protein